MWPIRLAALTTAIVVGAGACSQGADNEGAAKRTGPFDSGPNSGVVPGEIVVMAKWGTETSEGRSFLAVMEVFESRTGIAVNYVGVGDQLPTVLSTQVTAGSPPDVALLPQPGLLRELAAIGALVPIGHVVADDVASSYGREWVALGSAEGVLYGVFYKGSNKSTVWYNVNLFDANGISAPKTWAQWVTASGTLLDAGVVPLSVGGADGWTLSDWFENVYVRTAGPEKYDQLTNREIPWTDQSVKDAFLVMNQLLGVEEFLLGGSTGALQLGFVDSVKQVFSEAPRAAIVYEGDFAAGVITSETPGEAGADFMFFDFPSIAGSPRAVIGAGDVAVVLNDKPEAFALIEFLATPEAGEIWAERGGFSSPNRNVDLAVYPDDVSRAAAAALANAEIFRFDLSDLMQPCFGATSGRGIWGGIQDWLSNPDDIDGVTARLEAEASC